MTIYNGPSIYNQGGGGSGGGGAYSDGGALVDGDFIKVENNTISTYDNTARSDINYYFEVAENEIINAVVELTTTVNATVHVYIVQNGFYIPLGNIGGDTVNAGDEYKVNITGDSFALEQVTGGGSVPVMANIGDYTYKILKSGSLYWTCENIKGGIIHSSNSYFKKSMIDSLLVDGWKLPTEAQWSSLINSFSYQDLKSTDHWLSGWQGTNNSGFDAKGLGYWVGSSSFISQDYEAAVFPMINFDGTLNSMQFGRNSASFGFGFNNDWEMTVRLVHDA